MMSVKMHRRRFIVLTIVVVLSHLLILRYYNRPAIIPRQLSRMEEGMLMGGYSTAYVLDFQATLPAGTTVTFWLEHYSKGEHMGSSTEYVKRLWREERQLSLILKHAQDVELDKWGVTIMQSDGGGHMFYELPRENITSGGTTYRVESQRLLYGQPMVLQLTGKGGGGNWPDLSRWGQLYFDPSPSLAELLPMWAELDRLVVLKVQLDPP